MKHPGVILLSEWLEPHGLSQAEFARHIGSTLQRVNQVCLGKRAISPELATRLGSYFGNGGMYWLDLQNEYELRKLGWTPELEVKK